MSRVVVHNHDDLDRLLADLPPAPIFALTAPGAAAYAGPRFLHSLFTPLFSHPQITPIIDCGDDPGVAWRALEVGWRHLLFSGPPELLDKVRSTATTAGAVVLDKIG